MRLKSLSKTRKETALALDTALGALSETRKETALALDTALGALSETRKEIEGSSSMLALAGSPTAM
jgi:hypothetical protein